MNREIKFRIIHKGKISGYEALTETGWKWSWLELNPDKGERWTKGVIADTHSEHFIRNQFTGLKDKNGVDIYEGDLLRFDYYHPTQGKIIFTEAVVFNVGTAAYATEYLDGEHHYFGQHIFLSACEIIGNIYENKNLLNE